MELIKENKSTYSLKFVFFILILSSTLFFDSKFGFNGFVPIGITGSILIAVFFGVVKVRLSDCVVVSVISFFALLTLVFTYKYWNSDIVQIKKIFFIFLGLISYLIVKSIIYKLDANEISKVINFIVLFHCSILFLQVVLYYSFSYDLNIGLLLGGSGHRAFAAGSVYRPTGLFDEPAIYSMFCSGLLLMRLFYNKKIDWVVWTGLSSIFLTLSFAGFILAGSILIIYSSIRLKLIIIMISLFFLAFISFQVFEDNYIVNRIDMLFQGDDSSTNKKFLVISDWISTPQLFNFGYGYIGLRDWTPIYYEAIYDLTFYITLLVEFGFYFGTIFLIYFFSAVIYTNRSIADTAALLVLLIKLTATHFPFLWVVLAFFFSNDKLKN